jgi:hypothetical protein
MNTNATKLACKENGQDILDETLARILCQLNDLQLELAFYW